MSTTIVAGPPGAGKTTYVHERMQPGDLVVDVDALLAALGNCSWYHADQRLVPFAAAARDGVLAKLATEGETLRHAWVITAQSDRRQLARLQGDLQAELVVMETPADECKRRVSRDSRRENHAAWHALIDEWFARWAGKRR